jgi:hypothetical protein
MQTSCWARYNKAAAALALVLLLAAAGCADDRARVDRTLDARETALNNRDLDAYTRLIAPDYVKARPDYNPRAEMEKLFQQLRSIHYQAYARNVQFENADLARVVQEYRMVLTNANGMTKTIEGVDHFLLKKEGFWLFAKWLIYQGLDGPAKKPAAPAAEPAPVSPEPPATQEGET